MSAVAVVQAECAAEGCHRASTSRGYCNMHYQRWRRGGKDAVALTRDEALEDAGFMLASTVLEQVGCTYRQLDHWRRMGYVKPALDAQGSGSRVGFTPPEVRVIRLLTVFSDVGIVPGTELAQAAVAHVRSKGFRGSVRVGALSISVEGLRRL